MVDALESFISFVFSSVAAGFAFWSLILVALYFFLDIPLTGWPLWNGFIYPSLGFAAITAIFSIALDGLKAIFKGDKGDTGPQGIPGPVGPEGQEIKHDK